MKNWNLLVRPWLKTRRTKSLEKIKLHTAASDPLERKTLVAQRAQKVREYAMTALQSASFALPTLGRFQA